MNTDKPTPETESSARRIAWGVAAFAAVVATILRVVPHPTNFSSVGACGLFGGARVRSWHAYLLPLGVMIASDMILWTLSGFDFNYSILHFSRVYVYGSFMLYVLIGRCLHDKNSIRSTVFAASLGGLQFFVLTNFCTWLFQPLEFVQGSNIYSRDFNGLVTCFAAALPFYQGETAFGAHPFAVLSDFRLNIVWNILADIIFTTVYLLVYARMVQRVDQPAQTSITTASV